MNEVITLSPIAFGMLCFSAGGGLVAMLVALIQYLNKDIGKRGSRE